MNKKTINLISLFLLLFIPMCSKADWQSTLMSQFPSARVVETFDNLQDWNRAPGFQGSGWDYQFCSGTGTDTSCPKNADGSISKWTYWTNKSATFEFISGSGNLNPGYYPLTNLNGTEVIRVSGPLFQTSWIGRGITVKNVDYTISNVLDDNHLTLSLAAPVENNVYVKVWGDMITGQTSGASCRIAQIWNVDGKTYIQPTIGTNVTAANFLAGETFQTADGKTGTVVGWPVFIKNHGPDKVWQGSGKSLVMDVGENDLPETAMAGLGAQRLGTYFGDGTPKSGYKKAHIFMMTKFSPTYFGSKPFQTQPVVGSGNVLKYLDLVSGFRSIDQWGTVQDNMEVNTYNSVKEYGYNYSIYNWFGGGASYPNNIFNSYHTAHAASNDGIKWSTSATNFADNGRETTADVTVPYLANDWFGIEIASDIGTIDNYDGSHEIWIYDKNGNEIGHRLRTGIMNLGHFDHYYNKTTIGGNRRYGLDESALDLRYWVDDFIVSGDRIGPNYFATVASFFGPFDTIAPSAPGELIIK